MTRTTFCLLLLLAWPPAAARFEEDLREKDFAALVGRESVALILFTETGAKCNACLQILDRWQELGEHHEASKKVLIGRLVGKEF